MSNQHNFFLDESESFDETITVEDEDGPVDLTGHVLSMETPDEIITGVVDGSEVTFTKQAGWTEDVEYVIDHTQPNGEYHWVLFGTVKVRNWL